MGELKLGWPIWVGVVSKDFEAQRTFYRNVLGFPEREAGEGWVEFEFGDGRTFEVIAQNPEFPQYRDPHCSVGFRVENIRAAVAELEARGVEQVSGIEGGPEANQYWCYFRDREGHLFEIAQRIG
jgi:catechol 2,3-dioxygenase-like lactoylglutathione lyase family enzyme